MTTGELRQLVRDRYKAPEWVLVEELRNGTGFSRGREGYADAVAFNTYPSRGLCIIGMELKASRSDWLSELKRPEKAEAFARWCDQWYVVTADLGIVGLGELPKGWGHMHAAGGKLKVAVEAEPRKAEPMDRPLLASILRNVMAGYVPADDVEPRVRAAREEGHEQGRQAGARDARHFRERVEAFSAASGINLMAATSWDMGDIGAAVAAVRKARFAMRNPASQDIRGALNLVRSKLDDLETVLPALLEAERAIGQSAPAATA